MNQSSTGPTPAGRRGIRGAVLAAGPALALGTVLVGGALPAFAAAPMATTPTPTPTTSATTSPTVSPTATHTTPVASPTTTTTTTAPVTQAPSSPTVSGSVTPSGAPQTGGGSTAGPNGELLAGGLLALLGAGGVTVLVTRRRSAPER